MTKKTNIKKQHITILVFLAIFFTGIAFFGNSRNQWFIINNQQEETTVNETDIALKNYINFSKYNLQEAEKSKIKQGYLQYNFTNGQPEKRNIYNNYSIVFPDTWTAYTYTNEIDRDDHGTNLLLKKNDNYIIVKQQLFESGTCLFDSNLEPMGMSYRCNLIESVNEKNKQWRIFMNGSNNETSWQKYGICDQNAYSEEISSYTTPTELDKALCSPWTNVGEINFYFSSTNNQATYNEFVEIIKSIEILK